MKQLISVLEKIHKQLEISNKIASSKLFIDFKNSAFKSETKKKLKHKHQLQLVLHTINKNIYDN